MKRTLLLLALMALVVPPAALAAGWNRNGHSKITWEVARSGQFGFEIPEDVSKVMALGSVAPDFFNFTTPAAHSQTPDPTLTEGGRLVETAAGYEAAQRKAYAEGREWHEFYMDAAVEAMKHGQRERAAFLLGYALHNREDFATHRGMNNLLHAGRKSEGHDPDEDRDNLAMARSLASIDIDRFRERVGAENWQLFTGHVVRRPGAVGSTIPEPMLALAPGLSSWDPTSGTIPPKGLAAAFEPDFTHDLNVIQAAIEATGVVDPAKFREARGKVESCAWGLFQRQDEMLRLLDLSTFRDAANREMFPRDREFLEMPRGKGASETIELIFDAFLFEFELPAGLALTANLRAYRKLSLPRRYSLLTGAEKRQLEHLIWDDLLVQELNAQRERLAQKRHELVVVKSHQLSELKMLRRDYHNAVGWVTGQKAAVARAKRKQSRALELAAGGPPRIDARPKATVVRSPSSGSGESASDHRTREGGYTERDHHVDFEGVRSRVNKVLGEHGLSLPK